MGEVGAGNAASLHAALLKTLKFRIYYKCPHSIYRPSYFRTTNF